MRLRRTQLAVPGVSEKMLIKAASSAADHVFCDLKMRLLHLLARARDTIADALNNLDWGNKVRCVRVMMLELNGVTKISSPLSKKLEKMSTQ